MINANSIYDFLLPEVVEHACSVTSLQMGETVSQITKDMDTYSYRVPIGVCAGITPYVNLCKLVIFGGLFLLKKLVKGSKVRGSNKVIASTQVNSTFGWDRVCVEILIVLAFSFSVKRPTWYCCRNLFL